MRAETHPGRSHEFLSRLHDGELTAGERAHFESHRAHCAECRRAAAEFEAALSLYRSTPTSPAAPDLASRVLRRLQQATPRRRPFGVFYGIDVRWAGAFAAALIVMIIGSAVYLRQTPQSVPATATPIPVQIAIREAQNRDEVGQKTAPSLADSRRRQTAAAAEETGREAKKQEAGPASPAGAAPPAAGKLEDGIAAESPRIAAAAPPAPLYKEKDASKPAAPSRATAERAAGSASRDDAFGGEPSATAASDLAAANQAPPFRFDITPLDGKGTPPARLGQPTDLSASYRGRSFVLEVSASGEVTEALPVDDDEDRQRKAADATAAGPLKAFRFQPGDGPRKLLLRIR